MSSVITIFLVRVALLAFVATQAIVPSGFMPSAISSGFVFSYCPGDVKNLAIIQIRIAPESSQLTSDHHHHHHHGHHHKHSSESKAFSDSASMVSTSAHDHCQFSLFSSVPSCKVSQDPIAFDPLYVSPASILWVGTHPPSFIRPFGRAPPTAS